MEYSTKKTWRKIMYQVGKYTFIYFNFVHFVVYGYLQHLSSF
jgi:hypothetical protein